MAREISFVFNGNPLKMMIEDHWTLLHLIREELGYTGTKEGCGSGECGACTVLLNGNSVNSCMVLAHEANGQEVQTIEGLASGNSLHPIQAAFVEHGAIQCGFCTPGMIMSTKAVLDRNPKADRKEIEKGLRGNLCRCTGYVKIAEAVEAVQKGVDK